MPLIPSAHRHAVVAGRLHSDRDIGDAPFLPIADKGDTSREALRSPSVPVNGTIGMKSCRAFVL